MIGVAHGRTPDRLLRITPWAPDPDPVANAFNLVSRTSTELGETPDVVRVVTSDPSFDVASLEDQVTAKFKRNVRIQPVHPVVAMASGYRSLHQHEIAVAHFDQDSVLFAYSGKTPRTSPLLPKKVMGAGADPFVPTGPDREHAERAADAFVTYLGDHRSAIGSDTPVLVFGNTVSDTFLEAFRKHTKTNVHRASSAGVELLLGAATASAFGHSDNYTAATDITDTCAIRDRSMEHPAQEFEVLDVSGRRNRHGLASRLGFASANEDDRRSHIVKVAVSAAACCLLAVVASQVDPSPADDGKPTLARVDTADNE
jgi:hypothetical protein